MSLLKVSGLEAGYGNAPVLQAFPAALSAGTITAIPRAKGAGKSTLLKAISRLVRR